jgi:hypothetical protein
VASFKEAPQFDSLSIFSRVKCHATPAAVDNGSSPHQVISEPIGTELPLSHGAPQRSAYNSSSWRSPLRQAANLLGITSRHSRDRAGHSGYPSFWFLHLQSPLRRLHEKQVSDLLRSLHPELRAAHGARMRRSGAFRRQGLIVILLGGLGRQVELVAPKSAVTAYCSSPPPTGW